MMAFWLPETRTSILSLIKSTSTAPIQLTPSTTKYSELS